MSTSILHLPPLLASKRQSEPFFWLVIAGISCLWIISSGNQNSQVHGFDTYVTFAPMGAHWGWVSAAEESAWNLISFGPAPTMVSSRGPQSWPYIRLKKVHRGKHYPEIGVYLLRHFFILILHMNMSQSKRAYYLHTFKLYMIGFLLSYSSATFIFNQLFFVRFVLVVTCSSSSILFLCSVVFYYINI